MRDNRKKKKKRFDNRMRKDTYASINVRVYLDHVDHTWEKKKNPSNSKKENSIVMNNFKKRTHVLNKS